MDPLDFQEESELLRFFHRMKTEMSLLENPHTFLCRLRDFDLIPEDRFTKLSRMKSRENIKKALYEVLDWLEEHRSIISFFKCVFKDVILNEYPTLKTMHSSLLDGSFHFDIEVPEKEERKDGEKNEGLPEDEGRKTAAAKKKKKKRKSEEEEEEEQTGPSSQSTLAPKKKSKKVRYSSPLKKGQKKEVWTWPLYKLQLPVTCGKKEGMLKRDKLAKGEKCILSEKRWFTPSEFETFCGKQSSKNWKQSIRCQGTPLSKLLEEGHLKSAQFKCGHKEVKKSLFPSPQLISDSEEEEAQASSSNRQSLAGIPELEELEEEEEEEEEEQQSDVNPSRVFRVSCGDLTGVLHKKRFATGSVGKSIRTETSWMSPEDFAKAALSREEVCWKRDITWEGKPLSDLARILIPDSSWCEWQSCKPTEEDLENQRNDDECCVCKGYDEEKQLVECDQCPRSFHQTCHLPGVGNDLLRLEEKWLCTFCIFRSLEELRYSDVENEKESVMSSQIPPYLLECQYLLLTLHCADEEQIFAMDPRLHLENYSSFIKTPMWLCNVAEKLQMGKYQAVEEFVSDVTLIFTNCATYNQNNAEFLAMGDRLKTLFELEFQKAFHIHQ